MGCCRAFVKHLVCMLAFATWFLGSILIAFTLWILSTSSTAKNFFNGTTPIIYVFLGLGGLLFTNGLLGWMGSYRRGGCMLKLFLFLSVLTIAAEIGGIISLSILRAKVTEIVEEGWNEMNQRTRNLIQSQLECCGLTGPKEFAHNTEETDKSCYSIIPKELGFTSSPSSNPMSSEAIYHESGCKDKLVDWIYKHKLIWISTFGGFLLFQVVTVLLSVSAINNMKSRSSSMESLDDPHHITYM
ncbi:CD82 antigen-like [Panonychus citri]|uniref:CD82 antigen-like n=1 Tax=Panonychus citri TaxID=50023 RepID=UPI00230825DB|nr:CD82 antigen-like [Panonychus citri]